MTNDYRRKYWKSYKGRMIQARSRWKRRGVLINTSFEDFYKMYTDKKFCDSCSRELTTYPEPRTIYSKVLDHCHVSGEIRGIICHQCNSKKKRQIIGNPEWTAFLFYGAMQFDFPLKNPLRAPFLSLLGLVYLYISLHKNPDIWSTHPFFLNFYVQLYNQTDNRTSYKSCGPFIYI